MILIKSILWGYVETEIVFEQHKGNHKKDMLNVEYKFLTSLNSKIVIKCFFFQLATVLEIDLNLVKVSDYIENFHYIY